MATWCSPSKALFLVNRVVGLLGGVGVEHVLALWKSVLTWGLNHAHGNGEMQVFGSFKHPKP